MFNIFSSLCEDVSDVTARKNKLMSRKSLTNDSKILKLHQIVCVEKKREYFEFQLLYEFNYIYYL